MDDKNQNTGTIFTEGTEGQVSGNYSDWQNVPPGDTLSSSPIVSQPFSSYVPTPVKKESRLKRLIRTANGFMVLMLLMSSIGLLLYNLQSSNQPSSSAGNFNTTQVQLQDFPEEDVELSKQSVRVNGQLQVNGSLVLSPTLQPTTAVAGQLYFDQTSNELFYYNGTQFVSVAGASTVGGGVESLQGLSGAVTLNAGSGIGITGNTISNTGVIDITSGNVNLIITDTGNGGRSLTVNAPSVSLQSAYDAGSTIAMTSGRDIVFNVAEQSTDPNFLVDLQCDTICGSNGRFAIQDDGDDVFTVSPNRTTEIAGTVILSNASANGKFSFSNDGITNTLKLTSNIIGNASDDGGSDTNTDYIQASVFNSGTGGTVSSVRVCQTIVDPVNSGLKAAIYSDNAGSPGALLSSAAPPVSASAAGWTTVSLGATVTLDPNTNYWIGFSTQVGNTTRYCRQDGGTTKYQGGFAWGTNFPANYNVTDVTSTTVAAYAPYDTITDHSVMSSAIKITENNEVAIRPLYNSDTVFQVLRRDGSTAFSVNSIDRYVFATQMMVGGADTNYTMFVIGNNPNGAVGVRRTTNTTTDVILELLSDVGGASSVQLRVQADGTLRIGNPTADTTGALLVLDTKNNSGDPALVDGAMYYNSSSRTMRCAQGGIWTSCAGGLVAVNTSIPGGNTITNTASETNFASNWSMPASYCVQGRTLRWTAQGTYSTTGTPNLTLRLKAGTTTLGASPAVTTGGGVTDREWRVEGQTICNDVPGATAATETQGISHIFTAATSSTTAEMANTSTTNLATNGALTMQISAEWGAADPANSITLRQFMIEAIGP